MSSVIKQEPKKNILIMDEIMVNTKPILTEPTFKEEIFKTNKTAQKHSRGSCFCLPCSPIDICCYCCRWFYQYDLEGLYNQWTYIKRSQLLTCFDYENSLCYIVLKNSNSNLNDELRTLKFNKNKVKFIDFWCFLFKYLMT